MNPRLFQRNTSRKGVVTIMVIWAIAIASIVVAATQILAFREATIGRESISRVQARWAARAGVETMIAIMEWHNLNPDPDDALSLARDLESNAVGSRYIDTAVSKRGGFSPCGSKALKSRWASR